ncbi:MAG: hypothetical protein FWC27_11730, partial [Firmicutes bacterium]|nr:hypothetical protein [Bacillota bacterium]
YCVAVTRELRREAPAQGGDGCRVFVLELQGRKHAALYPLGNWARGETLTREDLACLHLRRMGTLRPFRCAVTGDTILAVTEAGVRAFDTALRPLDGMLELMPAAVVPHRAYIPAARDALLAKEA